MDEWSFDSLKRSLPRLCFSRVPTSVAPDSSTALCTIVLQNEAAFALPGALECTAEIIGAPDHVTIQPRSFSCGLGLGAHLELSISSAVSVPNFQIRISAAGAAVSVLPLCSCPIQILAGDHPREASRGDFPHVGLRASDREDRASSPKHCQPESDELWRGQGCRWRDTLRCAGS